MLLAEQLVRQRYVRSGPLVLGTAPIKYPAPTPDRDRTVSRLSLIHISLLQCVQGFLAESVVGAAALLDELLGLFAHGHAVSRRCV